LSKIDIFFVTVHSLGFSKGFSSVSISLN
jgi:hypothetical protein